MEQILSLPAEELHAGSAEEHTNRHTRQEAEQKKNREKKKKNLGKLKPDRLVYTPVYTSQAVTQPGDAAAAAT